MVEVFGLAADVDHTVDRRRSAQHLAARVVDGAAVDALVRFGLVTPGQRGVIQQLHVAGGDVDQRIEVSSAGLDQDDPGRGILGQTVGQDAAGRTGTYDDVIRLHCGFPLAKGGECMASGGHGQPAAHRYQPRHPNPKHGEAAGRRR